MNNYLPPLDIPENHPLLTSYSPLITALLINRGITTPDDAQDFLQPDYAKNYDPLLMQGIPQWIERIYTAITNNERITIYADYDADGIPGSVVLASLFDAAKYTNYDIYIPHRHDEGYGIHIDALTKIQESGTDVVVTIDVGITGHEAAHWAREHDLELIITDHHLPGTDAEGNELLPDVDILINPKQSTCSYPDAMLCGCGVIYKCVQGFLSTYRDKFNIHEGWEKWLLDMVGISTISDMVPLRDENRLFAYYGLQVIKKTRRIGLKTLIWNSGINQRYLGEEDIGFGITPRINAASRMSHPEDALAVFLAKDEAAATDAVSHLDKLNKDRKKLVAQTMKSAYKKLAGRTINNVIVVGSPDWKAGILGLVASKITEKYHVPAFVWSEEHGVIKGSCRSYDNHHLVKIMSSAEEKSFMQFGGHAGAGGFSCEKNEIHFLQERLDSAFDLYKKNTPETKHEVLQIDNELTLDTVTKGGYDEIQKLAPFGIDNPKPLFLFKNITPVSVNQFGKTKEHLEISFTNGFGKTIRAMTFFKTPDDFNHIPQNDIPLDLLAHIEYSVFMGRHELRLKIVDVLKPE